MGGETCKKENCFLIPFFLPFTAAFYARARAHHLRYRARASAQVIKPMYISTYFLTPEFFFLWFSHFWWSPNTLSSELSRLTQVMRLFQGAEYTRFWNPSNASLTSVMYRSRDLSWADEWRRGGLREK
jgi:hypothetical protein